MKIKRIEKLAKKFINKEMHFYNDIEGYLIIRDFVQFLKERDKIRKCGTTEGQPNNNIVI